PNCSSSSLGILGRSRKGFFLVGIHAPLTHVMPEHKISDTLAMNALTAQPANAITNGHASIIHFSHTGQLSNSVIM
ncbi:hypothetical protein, partial [Pseudomonas putida]|uniref:hypothetical protein n=1 Tax=Pseudomonas putida TaxID=303 RepID=UPI0039DF799B